MQIQQLPTKFEPYIINNSKDPQLQMLDQKLNSIFEEAEKSKLLEGDGNGILSREGFQKLENKAHIVTHPNLPNYIIKGGGRTDLINCCAADQHIYRVRTATRIQKIIDKNKYTDIIVPKKYLHQYKNKWFVIAEKLDIDHSICLDTIFTRRRDVDNCWKAEMNGQPIPQKRFQKLSQEQARKLVHLIYDGHLLDPKAENFLFTKDGKIALIDTEPLMRNERKKIKGFWWLPGSKTILKQQLRYISAACSSEVLRKDCADNDSIAMMQSIDNSMRWRNRVKIICQTALPILSAIGFILIGILKGSSAVFWIGISITPIAAAYGLFALTILIETSSISKFDRLLFKMWLLGALRC